METKKISYAITVCNEEVEIDSLLMYLDIFIINKCNYEIVILKDKGNTSKEVKKIIKEYSKKLNIITDSHSLGHDFAAHKNYLNSLCTGDWIFNIDADEIPHYTLIDEIQQIVSENPQVEGFMVPRINIVEGIEQKHIDKWHWSVNGDGFINWPDWQLRIYKNVDYIKWEGKVHEHLTGFKYGIKKLPETYKYAFRHEKEITRQILQNDFYEKINGRKW